MTRPPPPRRWTGHSASGRVGRLRRAGRTDVQAATALAAVTRLAEFSGVGAQTTDGAGSVRIVRNRQPATG